ncbi:MAG: FAD-dependent oxidoreductase [Holophaga sp.]|nr:FAD-dependent oxidoreductase [Holophaga sp.]
MATCLQNEAAFCTAACPFHLDVRDFIAKLQRGGFHAAYRSYLHAVGFPGIVSALCPEPCKAVCPRRLNGGAVEMRMLERAAMAFARSTDPDAFNMPAKPARVAVIGAGISGLACALRMAARKYQVTVFERSGRIGGHLHGLLPPELILADIQRQFMHEAYDLRLDEAVGSLEALDFAAVYVATGAGGETFGLVADPGGAFASVRPGVFLGGSLTGADTLRAIADGLQASDALERYIKAGGMNHPAVSTATALRLDPARFPARAPVAPAGGAGYTREEAAAEAQRCLKCACDACVRACDLMRYFQKYPRRIAEEVEVTIHPGTLDGNGTVATRLIATCNQCGLCREVCPQGIDTGDLLRRSHRIMHEKGAMPWAFHDFFLRDMAFADLEAGLCRAPLGHRRSRLLFFPGCQLGGSDPRYVTAGYRFLLERWPDTAIRLGCCGAPADWAGDEGLQRSAMARLRTDWLALGRPRLVFACPTCRMMLARSLPELDGAFLYDLMLEQGLAPVAAGGGTLASVYDPCASRDQPELQRSVRALAERAGFRLEALPMEGRLAQCCSWGGQVSVAYPPYAQASAQDRIRGPHPYITYCSNCRDTFAAAGKPAWHILDLWFGLNGPDRRPPTVTGRRANRIALKRRLLAEFWGEPEPKEEPMPLIIAPELRAKLDRELLLETEVMAVIEHCEATGAKLFDPVAGTCSGHLRIGNLTFWVEYRPAPGGFQLVNAYSHRMSIEEP